MVARELISDSILPVNTSDSIQKVLDRMYEFRVNHLPVVEDGQFLGLVSDEDFIELPDYSLSIGNASVPFDNLGINQNLHIYEVIRLFYERRLSLVPVIDENRYYIGAISVNTMVEYMAGITAVKEPGGIIVLEISNRNNSLAHIAQIVESNNAQILSSYINSFADSTKLEVTIKVNRNDIAGIVAAFIRYDYKVIDTFNDIQTDNDANGRYDQLMNYLNI